MKTESLIDMLARQAGPAPRAMAARRLTPAVAGGRLVIGSSDGTVLAFGAPSRPAQPRPVPASPA